jgi:hypothetical protein
LRGSFVLGVIGGIFGFFPAIFVLFLATAFGSSAPYPFVSGEDTNSLLQSGAVALIGSILAIIGGAMGKRRGGVAMLIGGIMIVLGTSLFGVLSLILLIVGAVLAIREKPEVMTVLVQPYAATSNIQASAPIDPTSSGGFCTNCGKALKFGAKFCNGCGTAVSI